MRKRTSTRLETDKSYFSYAKVLVPTENAKVIN